MRLHTLGATLALLASSTAGAAAGTTGMIDGRVVATDGTPLAGAMVTAAAPSGTATMKTDRRGHYRFLSLAPDRYIVSFQRRGNLSMSAPHVNVHADQTTTCNARLPPQLTGQFSHVIRGNDVVPCAFLR